MANEDTPMGFIVSSTIRSNIKRFYIDGAEAVATFHGDLVKYVGDSSTSVDRPTVDVLTAANVAAGAPDYCGPIVGVMDTDQNAVNFLAASTAGYVDVETDPYAELLVQVEDGGTALTNAAFQDQADPIFTHAGSTLTGRSGAELNDSVVGDGSNAMFILLRRAGTAANDMGANVKLIVRAAEHAFLEADAIDAV